MKKKIFSILLSLCMVLTMIPVAAGVVWAEDESPIEKVTFNYAYDVQRKPAYPAQGEDVALSSLAGPIVTSGDINNRGTSNGEWTLTKAGTYAYMVASNKATPNLTAFVPKLSQNYTALNLDTNKIIIHELKNKGVHIAYGVIVAYGSNAESGERYALFQGDTLSGSGAGYFITTSEATNSSYTVKASELFTEKLQSRSINLELPDGSSFKPKEVGYNEDGVETKTVKVINTGAEATGDLTVALSGDNKDCFEILLTGSTTLSIAGVGETATFSIKPQAGLLQGTYTATVTVSGQNIVAQSFGVSFTVKAKAVTEKPTVTISGDTTYKGSQIKPAVTVRVGENTLTENTDYTVTYGENINAGKGTVTIKETPGSSYGFGEVNKEFTITQREVNISGITADNKVYDGNTNATITSNGTLEGKIENDDISYNVTGTFENKDAGEDKTVNLAISLTGDKAGNYKLAENSQKTATANITAREITLTGGISAVNRAYEANNTEVTLTKETLSFDNLVNGEVLDINIPAKGTIETPDAGENKAVTYSGVTLADVEGKDLAKNYRLSNQLPEVKVGIAKATATITVNDKTAYIGDKAPDLSKPEADKDYTVSGLLGEDKLTTVPTLAYESTPDMTKTAEYTINASGASAGGNYTITYVPGKLTVSNRPSDGGSHSSSIQKPTIIAGEGAETSLSILGTNLTIKVTEGYELTDVILNGVSKGKVTELTGLRTGDKVEVKTEKKQEKPTKEEIIAALDSSKLVARSKLITLENGKKAVRVTWYDQNGNEIDFDGIEVYRSVKRYKGYGLEPFYTTKGDKSEGYYVNTKDLKEGTTYYYKVRGYVTIDGQKYYTDYSDKAWRTIK